MMLKTTPTNDLNAKSFSKRDFEDCCVVCFACWKKSSNSPTVNRCGNSANKRFYLHHKCRFLGQLPDRTLQAVERLIPRATEQASRLPGYVLIACSSSSVTTQRK